MDEKKDKFRKALDRDVFFKTKVIYLELSNLCNYTAMHPQCPTNKMEKHVMSLKTIESIARKIGKEDYDRLLYPYMFSEPMIDPRLYTVIDIFRKYVPKAKLGFTTNGSFLYKTTLDELVSRGISRIVITAYFPGEYERLNRLINIVKKEYPEIFFTIKKGYPLRKRMFDLYGFYTGKPLNWVKECFAPYRHLYINCHGDVCLCCNEWKATVTFGSLKEKSFREIFKSDKMIDYYFNLLQGNRAKYPVCSRCRSTK